VLHDFLAENHDELIDRCRAKVAQRQAPRATRDEMDHGIPLFLGQLTETLRLEDAARARSDPQPAHTPGDTRELPSAMRAAATEHGHELRKHGYTVDQVVHGYGDLCQAITELAIQRNASVSPEDFKTLNGCLDNAIASAVTEFAREREEMISASESLATSERLGFLAHELRNYLNTAILSFAAMRSGSVAVNGATAGVMDRSLMGLRDLIDHALADVRLAAGMPARMEHVAVDAFIAEIQVSAALGARAKGCSFTVSPIERGLAVHTDRPMLSSSVSNLLQNAFKFTRAHSHVTLRAYGRGERVLIEVEDECGRLPAGKENMLFTSFEQHGADRSGLGLGLSISRRAVEACGGTLAVRDMPGLGCVFTIDLPRHPAAGAA
jgi:signal transduction histidine kinase